MISSSGRNSRLSMSNDSEQISEIDRLMNEMDLTKQYMTTVKLSTKKLNTKRRRKEILFQPALGSSQFNGFLLDSKKRARNAKRKTSEATKRVNQKSVVDLVRTLQDEDYNVDIPSSTVDNPLFLFLPKEQQQNIIQHELKRVDRNEERNIESRESNFSRRPDSALTFIQPSMGWSSSSDSFGLDMNDEDMPPHTKLQYIDNHCQKVLSKWYNNGANPNELQDVIDLRITGIALARMTYGQKSLQFAKQVIELASAYVKINQVEQAMPHLKKSLTIVTEYLDRSKESFDNITLFSTLSADKARQTMREGKKLLPSLLLTLGRCYMDIPMYTNAHTCLQEAHRQFKAVSSEEDKEHSDVEYQILMSQAELYIRLQQFERAMSCLEQSWEIKEAIVGGEKHEDIAKIYREMGSVHWKCSRSAEAIEAFNRAYSIYSDLPDEISSANGSIVKYFLGMINYQEGNTSQALIEFEMAKTGVENFYGPIHEKTLKVYYKLAQIALESAKIQIATNSHAKINGGEVSASQEKSASEQLDKAIRLYREILKRQEKLYGTDEHVTRTFQTLGDAYQLKGDYLNGSLMYRKAIRMAEELPADAERRRDLLNKYMFCIEAVKSREEGFLNDL